jgi:hypothetical protein
VCCEALFKIEVGNSIHALSPFVKGKMKKIFLSIEEMEMAGANQ